MRRWICGILALLFLGCATYLGNILWTAPVDSGPNPIPFLWGFVGILVAVALLLLWIAVKPSPSK